MDSTSRFQTQDTGSSQQVPLGTGSPGAAAVGSPSGTTTGSQTSGKHTDRSSSPLGSQQDRGDMSQGQQQQPQTLSSDIGSSGGQPKQQQLQPQQRQGMSSSTGGAGMGSNSSSASIPISGDTSERGRWEFLSQKPLPPNQPDTQAGARSTTEDTGIHRATNPVERWMRKSMSWQQPHQAVGPILGTRDGLFMFAEGGFGHRTVDSPGQTPVMGPLARPASDVIDSELGNIPKQPFGGQIPQSNAPGVIAQPPILAIAGQQRGQQQQYGQQYQQGGYPQRGGMQQQQRYGDYDRGGDYRRGVYRGAPYQQRQQQQQPRRGGYDEDWYPSGRDEYYGGGQEEYRQGYYPPQQRYPQQERRYYDYYDEDYDDYRGRGGQQQQRYSDYGQQRQREPYRPMGGHRGGYDEEEYEGYRGGRMPQGGRTGQQGSGLNWRQRADMEMRRFER